MPPETPARTESAALEPEEHLLLFALGDAFFAIDSVPVQEVLPIPVMTRVPRTPAWMLGLMNLRGEVVPVVDPRSALGCGPAGPNTPDTRVIVLSCSRGRVGFVADSTQGIAICTNQDILAAEHPGTRVGPSMRGVLMRGDRLVSVVDSEAFLAGPDFSRA